MESWPTRKSRCIAGCIARTTNAVESLHFGLQALFQCHRPTLWTFVQGIEKDLQMQRASFLEEIAGTQPSVSKRYKELKVRVQNTVDRYLPSEILVQLIFVQLRTFLILDSVGLYSGCIVGLLLTGFIFYI